MMLAGCSGDERYLPLPDIQYRLVVTDSIGVELGEEEHMFAWPTDPTYSPDGRIFVVDRLKHAVFVHTTDGDYLTTLGREGEGPGEFHMPSAVEVYPDGSLLICDDDCISSFDSSFAFVDQMIWDGYSMPWLEETLDDGTLFRHQTLLIPS
ncbi:MAG: 6-bladed beta-propeller [Candidatus Fermentibacteraceae bacterium]|nr:6-bladed beta-propeller [Candidatus Fermentibacteraceae bacterium]MBN2608986.1 6-bladed beta-propeller [Candidatus Fermentibacteraceae bacterium]